VPEGSERLVTHLANAPENEAVIFALPSPPFLVTPNALCQDHHRFETVDMADDRGLHLYHLIGCGINVDPLGLRMGASVFPDAFPAILGLVIGATGKVVLHVGVLFTYEPTDGETYEPTAGATDDPYPEVPACASAAVPERANALANTIVHGCVLPCRLDGRQPHRLLDRSIKIFFKRDGAASCSHRAAPRC
jgi:hypothetical protein